MASGNEEEVVIGAENETADAATKRDNEDAPRGVAMVAVVNNTKGSLRNIWGSHNGGYITIPPRDIQSGETVQYSHEGFQSNGSRCFNLYVDEARSQHWILGWEVPRSDRDIPAKVYVEHGPGVPDTRLIAWRNEIIAKLTASHNISVSAGGMGLVGPRSPAIVAAVFVEPPSNRFIIIE